jgi:integrase
LPSASGYVPASHRFEGRPKLKTMRRDEFTIEEYRKLHSVGRKWIRAATTPQGILVSDHVLQFHAHHVQHGDATARGEEFALARHHARQGSRRREIVVMFVQGKGKSRKLVAPKSVGEYLDRVRELSKATASPMMPCSRSSTASPPNISTATPCRPCS